MKEKRIEDDLRGEYISFEAGTEITTRKEVLQTSTGHQ
jgi:hypothetical protein